MRLEIESMAYGPDAVAHAGDGRAVFVSGAVPGDVVEAEVVREEKSFLKARVTEILEPSPDRVEPRCPWASVCGGCPWAAMDYPAQLTAKRDNVVQSLARIGHLGTGRAEALVAPVDAPGAPWGYRNKVELAVERRRGRCVVGMHGSGGSGVVKVDRCLLLDADHERLVKAVSGSLSYLANSHDLDVERVGIRASRRTGDVEVALWTEPSPFPRAQAAKVIGDATGASSIVRVMTKGPLKARRLAGTERLGGNGWWSERVLDEVMRVSAPSFFQVNTLGAERLIQLVMEGLAPTRDDSAMDLYAGGGTFTLPLARRAGWVDAVESYGPAVGDLRRNLERAGIDNADPVGGDAGREFPDEGADVVVVDPPRAGLAADVVEKLSALDARAVAYVSCDPATLARDLARFEKAGRLEPVSVRPVDLFPQTFHVETVTLLRPRG